MAAGRKRFLKPRIMVSLIFFGFLYLVVGVRLFVVQVVHSDIYRNWGNRIRHKNITVPSLRGAIFDRNGRELAIDIQKVSVFADTNLMDDPKATADEIARVLNKNAYDIKAKLTSGKSFVWIARWVDPGVKTSIDEQRLILQKQINKSDNKGQINPLRCISTQREIKRAYPAGMLAAQVLGFTDIDNKGVEGIEHSKNKELTGTDGKVVTEIDILRRSIPETRLVKEEPKDGSNIHLTLDITIQHIAEKALKNMAEKYKPTTASAIVLNPKTGDILAIANYPTYDPNQSRNVNSKLWRNRAVSDLYEPGSTLKTLTVAAAINEGFNPNTVFTYCNGRERIKGGSIPCVLHHPYESGHGRVDMNLIIRHSCNIGAAHVAMRLGAEKLRKYEELFGLNSVTKSGFGGEARGWLRPAKNWRTIELADIGFGQGIAVTPLQMAAVYAAIANKGVYVTPKIIKTIELSDVNKKSIVSKSISRRVVSIETAQKVTRLLESCVIDGTGKPAQIDGYTVAGKTGSAQVVKTNGRGYESGAFVASFMGFAPAKSPQLVVAVVVNKPKGSHWGATVAAPVFKEITEKSLWYLKIPADAIGVPNMTIKKPSVAGRQSKRKILG